MLDNIYAISTSSNCQYKSDETFGIRNRPAGQNCVVAVLPFDGYNIEDAIVLAKHP